MQKLFHLRLLKIVQGEFLLFYNKFEIWAMKVALYKRVLYFAIACTDSLKRNCINWKSW